jgi:peptidyl-prolyl cis-trans isomerase A (cyclophilin A)
MKVFMSYFLLTLLVLAGGLFISRSAQAQDKQTARPVAVFNTNHGVFKVELFTDLAPKTTQNFIGLAEKKFYDGTIFHRIIDNFMIQGGDPDGVGSGGPGYTIPDEFGPGLKHDSVGILSMANAGPNTGGSQFFVTLAATPWLDGKHAIFGKVIEGLDVVKTIGSTKTGRSDRPVNDVKIETLVIEKPGAETEKAVTEKPAAGTEKVVTEKPAAETKKPKKTKK